MSVWCVVDDVKTSDRFLGQVEFDLTNLTTKTTHELQKRSSKSHVSGSIQCCIKQVASPKEFESDAYFILPSDPNQMYKDLITYCVDQEGDDFKQGPLNQVLSLMETYWRIDQLEKEFM